MNVDLSRAELAYLSRAISRQRNEKPADEATLAVSLNVKVSGALYRATDAERIKT